MKYTEAVIMETLRMSAVAPIGIPHRALDDAKLGNYIIPKVVWKGHKALSHRYEFPAGISIDNTSDATLLTSSSRGFPVQL